jgi:hypothetical protein
MGAELISWKSGTFWSPFDADEWKRLQTRGIDVKIEEVTTADDGTLEYRGEKIILYIRDQRINAKYQVGSTSGYRFHIAYCKKLEDMRQKGRYDRYVVSTRKDGKFIVNRFNFNQLVEKDVDVSLPVCKLCLRRLNYQNYTNETKVNKESVWKSFDIIEFFEKYSSTITKLPKHTEKTAPLDIYTPDWEDVSRRYRGYVNWICEDCGRNLENFKSLLHVHHKNGVRTNNNWDNLLALCVLCHANRPDHEHLRKSQSYLKLLDLVSERVVK